MLPSNTEEAGAIRLENSNLEDVVAALLSDTPIWRGENAAPFVFTNPVTLGSARVLSGSSPDLSGRNKNVCPWSLSGRTES